MRKGAILAFALGLGLVFALSAAGQPPGGGKGGKGGKGFGGPGGFGMKMQPGEIMPTAVQEMLKLTDEQKKQVEELQKDVDAKLDKILTEEQKTQLKQMKERGFGGPGGKGGFGGPGGKGGFGGGFPGKKGPDKKDPDKE